jgi:hypothetical protein
VRGHAAGFEKHLDDPRGDPGLHRGVDQGVGDAVVVVLDLDMVIDVDGAILPGRELVATRREGPERRAVQALEEIPARDPEVAQRPVVELLEQLPDGGVQLGQVEEAPVPQGGQDPALDHEHGRLDLRLVPGAAHAGRHDRGPVEGRALLVRAIDHRLVAAGRGDGAAQVIYHRQSRWLERREPLKAVGKPTAT